MLQKVIILLLITLSTQAMSFECSATRTIIKSSHSITITDELAGNEDKKFIDIKEGYFSFTRDTDETYMAMITLGPNYTTGSLAKATFDKNNEYKNLIIILL